MQIEGVTQTLLQMQHITQQTHSTSIHPAIQPSITKLCVFNIEVNLRLCESTTVYGLRSRRQSVGRTAHLLGVTVRALYDRFV